MLRAAPEHDSVRAAPHRCYSCSGSRFRKHSSQFPYRWGLLLRDASDHAVQAAPHRWYSRSGSRFRKRPSRVSYRWRLALRAAPNHGSVRAALCGWYSRSGCSGRKCPSRFPYKWGLLLRAAPDHGYLGLFRRIPHHTPHRPLWRCRLLCHRNSLQYQLRSSSSCSCGCVCRCRRMTTCPMRDRRSNSLRKFRTFPDCRRPRSRRCRVRSLLRRSCCACICGCACSCRRS